MKLDITTSNVNRRETFYYKDSDGLNISWLETLPFNRYQYTKVMHMTDNGLAISTSWTDDNDNIHMDTEHLKIDLIPDVELLIIIGLFNYLQTVSLDDKFHRFFIESDGRVGVTIYE